MNVFEPEPGAERVVPGRNAEIAAGLRALAAMAEATDVPAVIDALAWAVDGMSTPIITSEDEPLSPRQQLLAFRSIAAVHGAKVKVDNERLSCHVTASFGRVSVRMYASAEQMADGNPPPTPKYAPLTTYASGGAVVGPPPGDDRVPFLIDDAYVVPQRPSPTSRHAEPAIEEQTSDGTQEGAEDEHA